MDVDRILGRLRADPSFGPHIRHIETLPPGPGSFTSFPDWARPSLVEAYRARGVRQLYTHQREAVDLAHAGQDYCVSTPTASGKTLCYNLPVLHDAIESGGASKALYLFPTKALAQDQVAEITELLTKVMSIESGVDVHCFSYDGDTPPAVRRKLRERGTIVVTNPWMLHQGILPNHARWTELFRGLRTIVLDEVHTLSGVFGSHVANVLRRLLRIARHYGAEPRFIASSATIGNPAQHLKRLLGREVAIVDRDGAPRGEKKFIIYNPPMVNAVAGLRANALEETRKLAGHLTAGGHQSIFFVKTRPQVEVLVKYLKDAAREHGRDPDSIRGYRGGYLPDLRREIERDLRAGTVKTVVSTNALELGVDIGRLDVAVMVGYPGTVASLWQQAGRAGRRALPSLAILVARSWAMDQYITEAPGFIFNSGREFVTIHPDNPIILANQVKCAAFELPFAQTAPGFGAPDADVREILDYLCEDAHLLHRGGDVFHWAADAYPAEDVSLEGEDCDDVTIIESTTRRVIGLLARPASIVELYEGAIYGHQGDTYQVMQFDHAGRRAYVQPVVTDFYTDAQTDTEVRWLREDRRIPWTPSGSGIPDADLVLGEVHVTTLATIFKKIRFYTRETVGGGEIHLPAEEMLTDAFGLVLSEEVSQLAGLHDGNRSGGFRGLASLLKQLAPLFVRCEPSDLGTCVEMRSPHFARPAITIFDRHRDGVGLAEALHHSFSDLLHSARAVLDRCSCEFGCPGCVGPPDEAGSRGKATARALAAALMGDRDRVGTILSGADRETLRATAGDSAAPPVDTQT